jgi:regulator of sigma E protease
MIYILAFLWVFGILVLSHELGHFLVAKLTGVKVLKFSVGFGSKLIGKKVGETEYQISAFPLGGYVKLFGFNPEEKIVEKERKKAFRYQPIRKRMPIIVAGSLSNFILGILLFSIVYSVGTREIAPVVGEVIKGSPAQEAGIRPGDVILKMNDTEIAKWLDIPSIVHESEGRTLQLVLKRGVETITTRVTPRAATVKNIFNQEIKTYQLGISASDQFVRYSEPIPEAIGKSFYRSWFIAKVTVISIVKMIQRAVPAEENVGGPYTIGKMAGQVAQVGFIELVRLTAVLSISIGLINLFPIPILDGGYLLLLAVEGIRRKPLSKKQIQVIQFIGYLIIMLLISFVLYIEFKRELFPDFIKFFQQITK